MAKTCLVTGGAGFIGSHVVEAILQRPELAEHRVLVLDDLSGGRRENLPDDPRIEFVAGSINDQILVERIFAEHTVRFVYHLAAYAAEGLSHYVRRFNYLNNVVGSMNVLNAAIRHEAEGFVFMSSIAVYGAADVPMVETQTPRPEDPYGIAKYAVEQDLAAARRLFGMNYACFRAHNVYGERQNVADPYRNVVGIFMRKILQGEPLPIFGDGQQQRAFTYVRDIADVIARAPLVAAAQGRVLNLGADTPMTVLALATRVAAAMGVPQHPMVHLPPRAEVALAYADQSALRDCFGPIDETPLDAGLTRMADWVKTQASLPATKCAAIEIRRGLPEAWRHLMEPNDE